MSMFNTSKKGNTRNQKNNFLLNLSFQGLTDISEDVVHNHCELTSVLDLSFNNFKCLQCLRDFRHLHTLILDDNVLDENMKIPCVMSNLTCLSINRNRIKNLCVFVQRLSHDAPRLKYLSMMKNDAAPSYFNGGTKTQNQDYRYYVISHFMHLQSLDGQCISDDEKMHAFKIYGRRWKVRKKTGV